MSIIRSNIARQLLAEGGAPRSPGNTTLQRVLPRMDGQRPGFYGPDAGEGGMESDFGLSDYSTSDVDFGGESGGSRRDFRDTAEAIGTPKTPSMADNFRANQLKKQLDLMSGNTRLSPSFIASLLKGPAVDVYNQDFLGANQKMEDVVGLDQYGMSGKDLTRSQNIQDALDKGIVTQSDFEKAFYGPDGKPPKDEGGDNDPIKKLKAPITEKIEEPKGEFDDILEFYGARFAEGGSPGNTTSQRVLPRADGRRPGYYGSDAGFGDDDYKDESASFDAGSGSGGSDQDFAAARAAIMGPSTYTDDSGNTIDVSNFQKQGFTQSKIAEMLGPLAAQYGLQQEQPDVLGVLGAGPGATFGQEVPGGIGTGTVPGATFGQEVTKGPGLTGTTGTEGTGFTIDDIADAVFDKGSLGGKAIDAMRSRNEAIKAAEKGLKDGGAIRQNYGLGSIVKKAVGAVKKVVKSPIGKAALFAGLGAYGLGAGPFKGAGFGSGFLKSDAFKKLLLKKGKDEFTFGNLSPLSLIGIPTVASYLFSKKEEDEDETLPTVANTDPAFQQYLSFYGGPRRFAQTGGDIDEAPMEDMPRQEMASKPSSFAELNMLSLDLFGRPYDQLNDSEQEILMEYFSKSKDMPERTMAAGGGMMNPNDEMLNLGGNEMDLRGGGFVPLGEYEKKDDVPARLSKNEFVFTADAVRAAGGGSVDRGADLMYKTMKNLENKIA